MCPCLHQNFIINVNSEHLCGAIRRRARAGIRWWGRFMWLRVMSGATLEFSLKVQRVWIQMAWSRLYRRRQKKVHNCDMEDKILSYEYVFASKDTHIVYSSPNLQ